MMNNNNHHPKNCSFAEEIVAYIYDEIAGRDKLVFENHLANCARCATEVAEFTNVSFSIGAWRDNEFSHLQTPNIVIPYETAQTNKVVDGVSALWWSDFRQIFSLSPSWITASAAMAVLVICVGLVFTVVKFSNNTDVAGIDNSAVKPIVSPTAEIVNNPAKEILVENSPKPPNDASEVSPKVTEAKITVKLPNNVVKVSDAPKSKVVRQNSEVVTPNKPQVKNNQKPLQNKKAPSLDNFEEDEDDSLRLADLFAEIETDR